MESLDAAATYGVCVLLDARDVAALVCTCRALRATVDDRTWRFFCSADWGVCDAPQSPEGAPLASFRSAYAAWRAEYGGAYGALFLRTKRALESVTRLPGAAAVGAPVASERDVDALVGQLQLPALAPCVRLVWRMLDAQRVPALAYSVYDHVVETRILSIAEALQQTQLCRQHGIVPPGSALVCFASCLEAGKLFFVDASTASVSVMLRNRSLHAACPAAAAPDGLLRWLERLGADISAGRFALEDEHEAPAEAAGPGVNVCLFSRLPPQLSVAVTTGVRVEASAVWMPEQSDNTRDAFAYRVRFSLLSLDEQAAEGIAPPVLSVQLLARHWVITDSLGHSEEVHGGGVIGDYPRLLPGAPAHAYQSQTPMRRGATRGGSMHGSFSFVHGTIAARTGPEFDARCAPFSLDVPEYAF